MILRVFFSAAACSINPSKPPLFARFGQATKTECAEIAELKAGLLVSNKGRTGLRAAMSRLVSPTWLRMTVRWLKDGVPCLNASVELRRAVDADAPEGKGEGG